MGICNFKTLDMTNKVITGITFITTCISEAGAGNWATKTLKFRESTVANPTTGTGGTGSSFVGGTLGNLSRTNFYSASNISRPVDAASTLFARLKAYLEGGGHTLVLYAGDSTPSSGYSENYLYHLNLHSPVKLLADCAGARIEIGAQSRLQGSPDAAPVPTRQELPHGQELPTGKRRPAGCPGGQPAWPDRNQRVID